jgi:hypothetical protein
MQTSDKDMVSDSHAESYMDVDYAENLYQFNQSKHNSDVNDVEIECIEEVCAVVIISDFHADY